MAQTRHRRNSFVKVMSEDGRPLFVSLQPCANRKKKRKKNNLSNLPLALPELLLWKMRQFCRSCGDDRFKEGGREAIGRLRTRAFAVPCSACRWFLRNLGSTPFSDGYLWVLGLLMLQEFSCQRSMSRPRRRLTKRTRSGAPCATGCAETSS